MICKCGSKKYQISEVYLDGVLILQCVSCPATYKCTGVYPLSVDFPGNRPLPAGQISVELTYKSGLEESDGQQSNDPEGSALPGKSSPASAEGSVGVEEDQGPQ